MVEEEQKYKRKWHNHLEGMSSQRLKSRHILVTLLQNGTLDVQEEDGHDNLLSLRTSHYSMTASVDEEELCIAETMILPLVCLLVALTTLFSSVKVEGL
jgi:hypothetical protein